MTKTYKISSLITVLLASLFIFGFSLAFFILPDKNVSENENRELASVPELSWESLSSGEFTDGIKDYFSDQFPLRGFFVSVKGYSELLLGKRENNGIFYAENGNMIDLLETDGETVRSNLTSLSKLDLALNGRITVAVAPRKLDALHKFIPSSYAEASANDRNGLVSLCEELGLDCLDLFTPLAESASKDEYVYYRLDHHPTTEGSYLIYLSLAEKLGFEPLPRDLFTVETVTDEFYGTTWSASATYGAKADKIDIWKTSDDDAYTVHIIDNDKKLTGFYDMSYLDGKDKYSLFLSGTNANVTVTRNDASDRPKMLILNDSFANSVVPFLARHYDIEMIDPRFLKSELYDKLSSGSYDEILLLMNLDTLSSSSLLSILSVGIPKE